MQGGREPSCAAGSYTPLTHRHSADLHLRPCARRSPTRTASGPLSRIDWPVRRAALGSGPMDEAAKDFSIPVDLRWADLDPNGHVRHSVYYDWGAMVRLTYLERHGVGVAWMGQHAIGPVLF